MSRKKRPFLLWPCMQTARQQRLRQTGRTDEGREGFLLLSSPLARPSITNFLAQKEWMIGGRACIPIQVVKGPFLLFFFLFILLQRQQAVATMKFDPAFSLSFPSPLRRQTSTPKSRRGSSSRSRSSSSSRRRSSSGQAGH